MVMVKLTLHYIAAFAFINNCICFYYFFACMFKGLTMFTLVICFNNYCLPCCLQQTDIHRHKSFWSPPWDHRRFCSARLTTSWQRKRPVTNYDIFLYIWFSLTFASQIAFLKYHKPIEYFTFLISLLPYPKSCVTFVPQIYSSCCEIVHTINLPFNFLLIAFYTILKHCT